MTTTQAVQDLSAHLTTKGTNHFLFLMSAISQELGLLLAYTISPEKTAKVRALQGVLDDNNYNQAIDIHLQSLDLTKDLEELEKQLHHASGQLFAKYKNKTVPDLKPLVTVSEGKN